LHGAVYRLKEIVKGTGVYSQLAELRKEQYFSPEQIRELQNERLRRLLSHAREHSPYYRALFAKGGIEIDDAFDIDRLRNIPLLRREDLQTNPIEILCDDARDTYMNSSGGSTGNPVNFYQDERYALYARAAGHMFMDWMGIRSGDKTAIFWGADRDLKELSLYSRAWRLFDRVKALNSFSMSDELILNFLEEMNRFKPRYIHGYASSLYLIARTITDTRPIKFRPVAIRSSAETLYDFQRREIEKAFGAKVFNFYGSREVNNLAVECNAHEGLHVFGSGRILEIVDADGRPVPDGVIGQIAVTDLTNFSYPFIRYLNGDVAVGRSGVCACGRGYPMIDQVCGRTSDMIIVGGQYIHGEFFTHLFYMRPEIRQFQVIQEDASTLKILVVAREKGVTIDDILARIRDKVGPTIDIEVSFTDNIQTTGSGKYRFTISKVGGAPQAEGERNIKADGGGGPRAS
jgi:phenylacetate-CoA ligase